MITKIFLLLCGHALADFSLQTNAMGIGKKRKADPGPVPWYYWLTSHALIHGGVVYLITQSIVCGIVEVMSHWWIDFLKCEGKINLREDQAYHLLFKITYLIF